MIRKNNKNGFTLVELLAVIVILAVILAIAVPGISGLIDNSKKSAFDADAKMILTGLEYQQLQTTVGTAQITVATNTVLSTGDLGILGANSANYTTVKIIDLDPLTICVETPTTSKFGAQNALATKSTVTTHTGLCADEPGV